MNLYAKLFEFICQLIDIQIKKCKGLATFGVGPDAGMNAQLVGLEIDELLGSASKLIKDITKGEINPFSLMVITNQVRFYITQEFARAEAGWLVDENNIHSPAMARLTKQLEQINTIATEVGIDIAEAPEPVTPNQKQCEHDSHAIAFYILDLTKKIRENPELVPKAAIPKHALAILRRNITTRYADPEIALRIEEAHRIHKEFLDHSPLEKSNTTTIKEQVLELANLRKEQLNAVLINYRAIQPDSPLFSPNHQWYDIGEPPSPVTERPTQTTRGSFFSPRLSIFGGLAVGVMAFGAYMLFEYTRRQALVNPDSPSLAP